VTAAKCVKILLEVSTALAERDTTGIQLLKHVLILMNVKRASTLVFLVKGVTTLQDRIRAFVLLDVERATP